MEDEEQKGEEKKKVIIALWGAQDTGKTTTLRKLAQEFLSLIEEEGDIQIAFPYKGKRIVISTAGDDRDTVEEGAYLLKALKADILVTATRTKGCSVDELEKFEREIDTKALWIYKSHLYKSYLTYAEPNPGGDTDQKESITKEQLEKIRDTIDEEQTEAIENMINEGQAKTIKLVIDNIIEDWEKKPESNSASSAPASK